MTDRQFLSIIIPVYNEADLLGKAVAEIRHHTDEARIPYEIILVDDGSTDDTWAVIGMLSRDFSGLRGVKLSRNFGKESAVVTGLEFAHGDAVIVMDGDLQHPPELIPEMVKRWREGEGDIVEMVKEARGNEPFSSRLRAKLFYRLMRYLTGLSLDNSSDFKLLDRKVVEAHNRLPESSRFFRGIVSWLGFRKTQIHFFVEERTHGRSKWSLKQLVRLAVDASTSFSSLPLHFVTLLGTVTFAVSVLLGLQTLYMKFSGSAVSGFTTVILLLLFIGSVLMLSLGIIGIYISRIFEEVKRRPRFIVEETINVARRD